jgi:hypothetical protein
VLCLWGNEYGRPLALGGKRAKPTIVVQWNHFPQPQGEHLAPKNLYCWELLYLPSKRPILHPSRGLDLLGTKVLQWCYSGDSVVGGGSQSHRAPASPAG